MKFLVTVRPNSSVVVFLRLLFVQPRESLRLVDGEIGGQKGFSAERWKSGSADFGSINKRRIGHFSCEGSYALTHSYVN